MKDLNITTNVTKYESVEGNNVSYQVITRENTYGYEMVNVASSESEVESIKNAHMQHITQLFTKVQVVDDNDDIVEEPAPPVSKGKRGRKPKKKDDDDFTYVRDVDFNDDFFAGDDDEEDDFN